MAETVLDVQKVSFAYEGQQTLFSDISFQVAAGEIFTILGANGSGKSTLLNCVSSLYRVTGGRILVNGRDVYGLADRERAVQIGYVSQLQTLSFDFTAREYLLMGRTPYISALRVPSAEEYEAVEEVMSYMKIEKLADKSMQRISGGERQQIQIARALVQKPKLLLLDEPTNHLDYGNQMKILGLIAQLSEEQGMAVVLTSHVPDHPLLLGSKAGILGSDGHMVVGEASDIVTEENLKQIYNTDLHLLYISQLGRKACLMGQIRKKQGSTSETVPENEM